MVDKHKLVDYILLAVFVVSFLSSVGLSLDSSSKFCVSQTSCDIVSTSQYAFTFGIKNSYFGVVAFALLSILTIWHMIEPHHHKKLLIRLGVLFGSAVAIYFLYLQMFVIGAFCTYCLIVDISALLGLAVVLVHWRYGHGWKGS